jgi:hypothetical protein
MTFAILGFAALVITVLAIAVALVWLTATDFLRN